MDVTRRNSVLLGSDGFGRPTPCMFGAVSPKTSGSSPGTGHLHRSVALLGLLRAGPLHLRLPISDKAKPVFGGTCLLLA